VLETEGFQDVVLLQTVLEEVKNRSPSVHQRVRKLLTLPGKRFYVFSNEHHREAYAGEPASGESANDRNDRGIRLASAWYRKHLVGQGGPFVAVQVVMVSNDAGNRTRALAEIQAFEDRTNGYEALSLRDYCTGLTGQASLLDMLETGEELPSDKSALIYPEDYMSEAQLNELLKSGKALRGTLQASSYSPFEGVVMTGLEGSGELHSIQVSGRAALNRAVHGDSVAVVLLTKEELQGPKDNEESPTEDGGVQIGLIAEGDEVSASGSTAEQQRPKGRIVAIMNRKWKAYCGSLDRAGIRPDASLQSVLFCPMDRRIPRIRLRTRQAAELAGQRLLVAIDGWARTSGNPHGHLVRQLGPVGDRATETEAILLEHDVAHADWTPQVLACLPEAGPTWTWSPADMLGGRADLRHLQICSIDPPGCTDIDDALHARLLPNGNIEVGVHIADVTHFVPANTPLDVEAAARGTTVYLVDRRIDMLPPLLGTNLCSLRCDVDRLAFSCIWELTPAAQIVSTRFTKSAIRSRASFTYDQAQARLDAVTNGTQKPDDPLTSAIVTLNGLAKELKARRIAAGALSLASPRSPLPTGPGDSKPR